MQRLLAQKEGKVNTLEKVFYWVIGKENKPIEGKEKGFHVQTKEYDKRQKDLEGYNKKLPGGSRNKD